MRKKPLIFDLKHSATSLEVVGNSPPQRRNQPERTTARIPFEVVGQRAAAVSGKKRNAYNHSVVESMRHLTTPYTPYTPYATDEDDLYEDLQIERPKLIVRKNPPPAALQLGEALDNEANYSRIVETLEHRLVRTAKPVKVNRNGHVMKKVTNLMKKDDDSTSTASLSLMNKNR